MTAGFPFGLALYFGLHLISRVLVSPSLELDEAEQLLHLQALSLGYGFQPPLYTWLQALVFAFTGPGVFWLALLKAVLLWLTWWAMYKLARFFYEAKDALAIGLSLALFPQFLWESQRDLTHTVLLVVCVALAWIVLLRPHVQHADSPTMEAKQQLSDPSWGVTALLGLVVGAAILAKYSAGLVAGNLVLYSKANNWRVSLEGTKNEASLWVQQETPSRGAVTVPPEGWVERGTYSPFTLQPDGEGRRPSGLGSLWPVKARLASNHSPTETTDPRK